MKIFKRKSGQLIMIAPLIIPLLILILLSPLIFGSYKIIGGIMNFFTMPVTGNIPIWAFFLGILLIVVMFKRREKQFVKEVYGKR